MVGWEGGGKLFFTSRSQPAATFQVVNLQAPTPTGACTYAFSERFTCHISVVGEAFVPTGLVYFTQACMPALHLRPLNLSPETLHGTKVVPATIYVNLVESPHCITSHQVPILANLASGFSMVECTCKHSLIKRTSLVSRLPNFKPNVLPMHSLWFNGYTLQ